MDAFAVDLGRVGLVDLLVLGAVVLAVVGALRRRRGLLGALGSALGALVVAWLLVVGVIVWGPAPAATAARESGFAQRFPVPAAALHDLDRLATSGSTDPGPVIPAGPAGPAG